MDVLLDCHTDQWTHADESFRQTARAWIAEHDGGQYVFRVEVDGETVRIHRYLPNAEGKRYLLPDKKTAAQEVVERPLRRPFPEVSRG